MPADALLMTIAVVTVFVAFKAVLAWIDRQTRPSQLKSAETAFRALTRLWSGGVATTSPRHRLFATLHRADRAGAPYGCTLWTMAPPISLHLSKNAYVVSG
jgi:hypothetical protein